jgi:hypothetical protein
MKVNGFGMVLERRKMGFGRTDFSLLFELECVGVIVKLF